MIDASIRVVAAEYGLTAEELHETLMARRGVRALCATVDAAIARGALDPRSYIADARLTLEDVPGFEISTEPAELARRVAASRPGYERERIEREFGRDDFR